MRLIGEWSPVAGSRESKWVAAAAAQEGGPVWLLAVGRNGDGSWMSLAEYHDTGATVTEDGFATHSGGMAWAEQQVDVYEGGPS
jgi:hypothetical protein